MSYKFGAQIVPGKYVMGGGGLGVLGSALAASGSDGPSPIYQCKDSGDDSKEFQMLITQFPASGALDVNPYDLSSVYTATAQGTYTFLAQLRVDGQAIGAPYTVTMNADTASDVSVNLPITPAMIAAVGVVVAVGTTPPVNVSVNLPSCPALILSVGTVSAVGSAPADVEVDLPSFPPLVVSVGIVGAVGNFDPGPVPANRTLVIKPGAFRVINFDMQAQLDVCFDWSGSNTGLGAVVAYELRMPDGMSLVASALQDEKVTAVMRFVDPSTLYEGQLFRVECAAITDDSPPLRDERSITIRAVTA